MSAPTVTFSATGKIQTYFVETAGTYVIEAAGGQGGDGATPGTKGARVSGMFYLKRGDCLKIVAGRRGTPGKPHLPIAGRGGDSLVWTGFADLPQPVKLMLSARGGRGAAAPSAPEAGETAGAGVGESPGPTKEAGSINFGGDAPDQDTVDTLITQWTSGTRLTKSPSPAGTARVDRCGYNAGAFRSGTPEVQAGDGYVSITMVAVPSTSRDPFGETPKEADAAPDCEAPSETMLPQVTPRPASWAGLLRKRPPSEGK